jgi:glutamine amidotransferase
MKVSIIKYNAGNIQSVIYALNRIGIEPLYTDDPDEIISSDKVIFPGQGEASNAMKYLRERKLDQLICSLKQPVFGICIGQQLLCEHSEEGDTDCLGIIPARVKKFPIQEKVPHMGWNTITNLSTPLFDGVDEKSYVYFVHSYYVESNPYQIATTNYNFDYASALHKDNFYAVQFHPEKSSDVGVQLMKNFIDKIK